MATVITSGIQTMLDNSAEIRNMFNEQVLRGCKAIGQAAEKHAKEVCPVDTGRLQGSISNTVTKESVMLGIYIGTNVRYAVYVETDDKKSHKPPTRAHFLRDAASQHGKEYRDIMEAALKD